MKNKNLEIAVYELVGAIKQICLGSIEYVVIDGAVKALINSWNDHLEKHNFVYIEDAVEINNWNRIKDEIINQ